MYQAEELQLTEKYKICNYFIYILGQIFISLGIFYFTLIRENQWMDSRCLAANKCFQV